MFPHPAPPAARSYAPRRPLPETVLEKALRLPFAADEGLDAHVDSFAAEELRDPGVVEKDDRVAGVERKEPDAGDEGVESESVQGGAAGEEERSESG